MASLQKTSTQCWVTLLTKPSYLPGVIILAHSLDKHKSCFPLVVQYTKSLGSYGHDALEAEAKRSGRIILNQVELLLPRAGQENVGAVADRFKDTFTKLRAFEVFKLGFTKSCFLDADMVVFRNPDPIFDYKLPQNDWIAANHPCVCNLDHHSWAPEDWNKGNCAYTTLTTSDQVFGPVELGMRPSYQLINGGMFLFHPSEQLWTDMMKAFQLNEQLKEYQFPDQDFLADFFNSRRIALSWKYNALKTMRYFHPALWSDAEVIVLHYIVDKPWDSQPDTDGIAGYLGRDGVTHSWWWSVYDDWLSVQRGLEIDVVDFVESLIKTHQPVTKYTPLNQSPGCSEDISAYHSGETKL